MYSRINMENANENTRQCRYIFSRGNRRNQQCNDSICNDSNRFCRRHYNMNTRRQRQLINELQINFSNIVGAVEIIEEDNISQNNEPNIDIGISINGDIPPSNSRDEVIIEIPYNNIPSDEENINEEPQLNNEENKENDEENINQEIQPSLNEQLPQLIINESPSSIVRRAFYPSIRRRLPPSIPRRASLPEEQSNSQIPGFNFQQRRSGLRHPLFSYLTEFDEEKESLLQDLMYETCKCCNEKIHDPKVILYCECQYHLKCFSLFKDDDKCIHCNDKIFKTEDEDYIMCSICIEPIKDRSNSSKTRCDHLFHKKCLTHWKSSYQYNSNKCPNCRSQI